MSKSTERRARQILVADDNRDSVDSLVMLLESRGAECVAATSGTAALELAIETQPDVVLLDIGMPDMDGIEVCRRIRATDWGRNVLIVAISGWAADEHRSTALKAGCDLYLCKPFELERLYEAIDV